MVHIWSAGPPPVSQTVATIDRRTTKNGQSRWRVRIRRRGYCETSSFGIESEAKQWAREVERAIERGEWNGTSGGDELTFGRLLDRYLVAHRPSRDSRRQLEWWRSHLGTEPVGRISRRQVLQLRRRLAGESTGRGRVRSSATLNRYMAAISGFLSWALRRNHVEAHPLRGIEPLVESPARVRCLSEEERNRLLVACREIGGLRLETLVVLALSTGAQRGELMRLRWSDLDLVERGVQFPGTGRRRARALPLAGPAMGLLRQLAKVRRIDGDEIFADNNGRVVFPRAAWKSAVESAGIKDFRFHDLRHSAASYLAMSGASLPEIAEILGHQTLQGVRRYSHLAGPQAPAVLGRMHDKLFDD